MRSRVKRELRCYVNSKELQEIMTDINNKYSFFCNTSSYFSLLFFSYPTKVNKNSPLERSISASAHNYPFVLSFVHKQSVYVTNGSCWSTITILCRSKNRRKVKTIIHPPRIISIVSLGHINRTGRNNLRHRINKNAFPLLYAT